MSRTKGLGLLQEMRRRAPEFFTIDFLKRVCVIMGTDYFLNKDCFFSVLKEVVAPMFGP